MRSGQVERIFSVVGGSEALGWVTACNVVAKWGGERWGEEEEGKEVEEHARGALGPDELAMVLFKGLWHALEPSKGFMSLEVKSW
jgi:hypothetical protein